MERTNEKIIAFINNGGGDHITIVILKQVRM